MCLFRDGSNMCHKHDRQTCQSSSSASVRLVRPVFNRLWPSIIIRCARFFVVSSQKEFSYRRRRLDHINVILGIYCIRCIAAPKRDARLCFFVCVCLIRDRRTEKGPPKKYTVIYAFCVPVCAWACCAVWYFYGAFIYYYIYA